MGRQHGVRLGISVKQRHERKGNVVTPQPIVLGAGLTAPDAIGMCPQHGLRSGCGAGSELHAEIETGIYRAQGDGFFCKQIGNCLLYTSDAADD